MNEKIDLTKILKNCPIGWKFYSSVYGDVEFIEIYRKPVLRTREYEWLNEKLIREWTIQDAKDGDVLVCNDEILLFKSYSALQGRISLYCWYNGHTNNFHSKEVIDILMTTRNKISPATKEQRDTLMKAMNDAGYEWDTEKKELKKKRKNRR